MGHFGAGRTWAVLLGTGLLFGLAEPGLGQVRLAQVEAASEVEAIEPFTIESSLDENNFFEEQGLYVNVHLFEGQAGQRIRIDITGNYASLILALRQTNEVLASRRKTANSPTDQVVFTLPSNGTYVISVAARETGRYTLNLQPASRQEITNAELLTEAEQLDQQVLELVDQGRYADAILLAQRSLQIRESALGESHPQVATSLINLAGLYREQGNYEAAEPLFWRSLSILETALGENHLNVAIALNNLATLYRDQGNYAAAEPLFQRSLFIRENVLGENHPDVAIALNNLATLYQDQGNYAAAEPLFQRAISILENALGESHSDVAITLNNLAALYKIQGAYAAAISVLQQSLSILENALEGSHPDVAITLNNLANLYQSQGNYAAAEPLYQRSLSIWGTALGESHPNVATGLNNLAGLYRDQGNYVTAESLYQKSLFILETALGESHPNVATSLNNLAYLYQLQGNYVAAESLYQRSLSIWETALGGSHPNVAASLNNLAYLYQLQGNYVAAESLYQRSLSILETAFDESHPDIAISLNGLAYLYQLQGNYATAVSLYQRSLSIWKTALGESHPDVATSLNNLASLYQIQGNMVQAIQFFQQGLAIEEENLDLNLATLTEAQRQDYAATLTRSTDWSVSLALQTSEAQSLGLTTLLRRKGRLLEAGSSSWQRLRQNLTPDDQTTLDEFVALNQQLATLTFNPPANLPHDQYRQQLAQLETQTADLEKVLAQRSATFRAETQPVDIATVQAQIPADGVLVEYARYRPVDFTANHYGAPRYAAYLLFPDGRIEAIDLGDAAEIDAAIQAFTTLLQDPRANFRGTPATITTEINPDLVTDITTTLTTLLLDPIAPHLQASDHLLISPDGELNRLPFEALQTDSGDFLIQQYQISYLNSGRDLLKFDIVDPSPNPAVILANPDYDQATNAPVPDLAAGPAIAAAPPPEQPSSNSIASTVPPAGQTNRRSGDLSQLNNFQALPGTAAEAAALAPLLPNAQILTATDATENRLKTVQAPRILHIATHGFFLPDADRIAAPTQFGDSLLTATTVPATIPVENPLLRSGLALAGFNTRSSAPEDGVFTALEASQLNLFGTQLVVLSACDTGLGDISNGEGVYGLRRAFALAGAETQLLSLWQVDDAGTQSLMTRYYDNLIAGMGRSDALRQVQLAMIEADDEYSHPYYWAAFILAGDWRPMD